jgi:hypothetical protein
MPSHKYTFYWLLFTVTILFTLVPFLITEGMFMDGLFYSTISRNLAFGIGKPFKPFFTDFIGPEFYEHPFLGFIIQSSIYRLFGDWIFLDKIYCFILAIIQAFLITRIWLKMGNELKDSFLPLLLYFTVNVVFWGYGNNALEITMSLFTTTAIYFLVKNVETNSKVYLNSFIAGIFIVLGILVKGPVALFPLAFYGISWILKIEISLKKAFFNSLFILSIILFLFAILYFITPAWEAFNKYLNIQVLSSVSGKREITANRFEIVNRLWQELLIMLLLTIILVIIAKWKKLNIIFPKNAILFILIGFSASLPILVSPKQLGFYLIPAFSMFALGFAFFIQPLLKNLTQPLENWKIANGILIVLLTFAFYYNISIAGNIGRDTDTIMDVKKIIAIVPKKEIVAIDLNLSTDYSLTGNMYRLNYNSLDYTKNNIIRQYLITPKNMAIDTTVYRFLAIDLDKYQLVVKK